MDNIQTYLPNPNYIDVAPNEYVTKYSFNRNFEKLIENDTALLNASSQDNVPEQHQIETYNKSKTYEAGEYVFYKINRSDTSFYVLKCVKSPNTHKPLVRKDIDTGRMFVINSEWWHIVGISDEDNNITPKDDADNYVQKSKILFKDTHELNPMMHPSGELGFKKSNILYKTFDNIEENRKTIFYPYEIQSFVSDNTTYYGYMRKWDNGLLEYDLTFRLGYISSDSSGIDLISANNLKISPRNYNYLYFKNDSDFKIFNQGGEYYTNVNGMKQVNLNKDINAYSAQIKFIEPFKDLNYMVFTSGMKNIETEAFNTKNEVLSNYDSRLIIDGLDIVGVKENSSFKTELKIPSLVKNIQNAALAQLYHTDGYDLSIQILSSSNLMNIEPESFAYSQMNTINIPLHVRYVGNNAFYECPYLSSIAIYVYEDPIKQLRIGNNAFEGTPLNEISIFYISSESTSSNKQQISAWLLENAERVGISESTTFYIIDANGNKTEKTPYQYTQEDQNQRFLASAKTATMNYQSAQERRQMFFAMPNADGIEDDSNIFTVNIDDLMSEINSIKESKNTQPKRMMMKSSKQTIAFAASPIIPNVSEIISVDENGMIVGYDASGIQPYSTKISIDLSQLENATSIKEYALSGFVQLTSLLIPNTISSIGIDCVDENCQVILSNVTCLFETTKKQNAICAIYLDDYSLSAVPLISAINPINSVYLQKSYVLSNTLSCQAINNLYVFSKALNASAFNAVNKINNCEFNSIDSARLSCGSNIFKYTLCSETYTVDSQTVIDEWIEPSLQQLNLNGNSFFIEKTAFVGINSKYLSIDMSNDYSCLCANAFASADINVLEISGNNLQDKLANNAFKDLDVFVISFLDYENFDDLCSTVFVNASTNNCLSIEPLTQIATQESNVWYVNDNGDGYISVPPYLCIENDILVSANIDIIENMGYDTIIIPKIVTKISDDALNLSKYSNSSTLSDLPSILNNIYVPNTVVHIGDCAFAGNIALTTLMFEPRIEEFPFEHIGLNIVSGCNSLTGIEWKTNW